MTLDQWSSLAQILGSIGVVVSLVFVGLQVRQNTSAIARNEHNNTMAQWTVVRMAVAQDRDMAELMTSGLAGTRELDDADRTDSPFALPGPVVVYVVVDDPDALHDRAVTAGAEIVMGLTDQDYGSRDFAVRDPHGNIWSFCTYRPKFG